jgi:hypothetical protein
MHHGQAQIQLLLDHLVCLFACSYSHDERHDTLIKIDLFHSIPQLSSIFLISLLERSKWRFVLEKEYQYVLECSKDGKDESDQHNQAERDSTTKCIHAAKSQLGNEERWNRPI